MGSAGRRRARRPTRRPVVGHDQLRTTDDAASKHRHVRGRALWLTSPSPSCSPWATSSSWYAVATAAMVVLVSIRGGRGGASDGDAQKNDAVILSLRADSSGSWGVAPFRGAILDFLGTCSFFSLFYCENARK